MATDRVTDPVAPDSSTSSPDGTRTDVWCTHCALPVPPALRQPQREAQFCCLGCETVFQMLGESNLHAIYQETRVTSPERIPSPSAYNEFDDDVFIARYSRPVDSDLRQVDLYLEGIHCAACVWLLERLPQLVPGVQSARVVYARSRLEVVYSPLALRLSHLAVVLQRLGYPPHPYREDRREQHREIEERRALIRIAVAGALAGNVMLIAFALYGGAFHGMDGRYRQLFRWISLALATPAVLWAGREFFTRAYGALRIGALHIDLPIALGLGAGFISGVVNTLRGEGEIYFDSVTALVFLLLVGRWLQRRQQQRAHRATAALYSLTPLRARKMGDAGAVRELPAEALVVGDRLEVRAGETFPADGVVLLGESSVNTAILTGESRPAVVRSGAEVRSGTLNLTARLEIAVTAVGERSELGQLIQQVECSARQRAPIVRAVDRIAGVFVLVVLLLAALTAAVWSVVGPAAAIDHAVALLIVCCPCALGLATPLAITASLGHAARAGILVKGGGTLEALAGSGTMFLDKTGTLTCGQLSVVAWEGDPGLQPYVAAVERESAHPVAGAIVDAFETTLRATDVSQDANGIAGVVSGRRVVIGNAIRFEGLSLPESIARAGEMLALRGVSPVFVALDKSLFAVIGVADPLRDDAAASVRELAALGWCCQILSGDHPDVVSAVARELAIDRAQGGVRPDEKALAVRPRGSETTVMVGDGVNDAAAFAAATVGIGVHGGASACLAVADIFFVRPGLATLVRLIRGARRTMRVIRRNLALSLVYNVVGAALAIAGIVTPVVAAILMPLSSLTVVLSSYKTTTFEE